MSQITPFPAPTSEAPAQAATADNAKPPAQAAPPPTPAPESNQRLVIQESGELGIFVYTVIDRTSGQVLTQIPRESISELARQENYSAGQVISTTA